MTGAEAIVQRQLEAYNRRDLDAFLDCYADDACLWRSPCTLMQRGRDEMRERYRRRFDGAPALHATIVGRIVFDRFVVDHEQVTGAPEGTLESVVTYEVVDGRIANAWFLMR
jgi:hypothetical protein